MLTALCPNTILSSTTFAFVGRDVFAIVSAEGAIGGPDTDKDSCVAAVAFEVAVRVRDRSCLLLCVDNDGGVTMHRQHLLNRNSYNPTNVCNHYRQTYQYRAALNLHPQLQA